MALSSTSSKNGNAGWAWVDENEANCCMIQLRLSQNKRIKRRFKKEHKLKDVADFVRSEDETFEKKKIIFVSPPMASYDDMEVDLQSICKELCAKNLSFIVKENQNKEETE